MPDEIVGRVRSKSCFGVLMAIDCVGGGNGLKRICSVSTLKKVSYSPDGQQEVWQARLYSSRPQP